MSDAAFPLVPGSTIGILGGGQLAACWPWPPRAWASTW